MVKDWKDWNESLVSEEFYMDIPDSVVQEQAENIGKRLNDDLVQRIIQRAKEFGGQETCVKIRSDIARD